MNVAEKSLDFECPICNAKPREECHRIDGHVMPQSHNARRNLIWGIKHRTRHEEVKQAVVRKNRKEH
jgi:hypothetical protein